MTPPSPIVKGVVEGITDEAALRKILTATGLEAGVIFVTNGKHKLLKNLNGYNNAARITPWVVLLDLDREAICVRELLDRWLPNRGPRLMLRVVVRELEAWLLADRTAVAEYFHVSRTVIPIDVEDLPEPKKAFLEVIGHCRKTAIREKMLPRPRSGASEGPAYASTVIEFFRDVWSPQRARLESHSLNRCMRALEALTGAK